MENEFENQRYALTLAEDGRIMQVTYECFANETMTLVDEIPDGNTYEYRYVDGEYIHDPLPQPEVPLSQEERIAELEAMLNALLGVSK